MTFSVMRRFHQNPAEESDARERCGRSRLWSSRGTGRGSSPGNSSETSGSDSSARPEFLHTCVVDDLCPTGIICTPRRLCYLAVSLTRPTFTLIAASLACASVSQRAICGGREVVRGIISNQLDRLDFGDVFARRCPCGAHVTKT